MKHQYSSTTRYIYLAAVAASLILCSPVRALDVGDPIKISEVYYDPIELIQELFEFIELYNAGADTLYLDGAVITDEGNNGTVEATWKFPGTPGGTTLPMAPGAVVLLVPDADLGVYSSVDFEFFAGGGDADNPLVSNLTKTSGLANNMSLSNSGDGITLSTGVSTGNNIPCSEIIDGISWKSGGGGDITATSRLVCSDPAPHPGTVTSALSLQRCPVATDSDSSAVDFIVAPRTPGTVNSCPRPPTIQNFLMNSCAFSAADTVSIRAQVIDSDNDLNTVQVFYKNTNAAVFDSLLMPATVDTFSVSLPLFPDQSRVEFYLVATDSLGFVSTLPLNAPVSSFEYRVGMQDITQVQGTTVADSCASSALAGQSVNLTGIVTHMAQEFSDSFFYIQQGTLPNSGIRIFVEDSSFIPAMGDSVVVGGIVSEFMCQTQVEMNPGCFSVEDSNHRFFARTLNSLSDVTIEENESMLVRINGPLEITAGISGGLFMGEVNIEFKLGTAPNSAWVGLESAFPDSIWPSPLVSPGIMLDAVTGIVAWRPPFNGDLTTLLRLEPRRDNDVDVNFTDVDPNNLDTPSIAPLVLYSNHPNPFNPATTIEFVVHQPGQVELKIINIRGQFIRLLYSSHSKSGEKNRVVWDGRDQFLRPVASGVYFYQLQQGERRATRKMLLVR